MFKQKFLKLFIFSASLFLLLMWVIIFESMTYAVSGKDAWMQMAQSMSDSKIRERRIKQTLRLLDEHAEKNTPKSLEQRVKILEQKLKKLEKMPQVQRHYRILENQERRRERFNNKRR